MSDTRDMTISEAASESRELRLAGSRLPYHPLLEERFGVDRGTWKVLTDVTFPAAEGPESIIMALSYCKARGLDIMKKPVHIVPVWDKKRGKLVDSVWPGIAESRVTAMRTGEYVGKSATEFGPEITETLGGVEVTYPEWAQVTVFRFIKRQPCAFVGEKVRWKEYYAKAKKDSPAPNDMWRTKSYSQISKCAEASALRMAFPEECPADATAEEMEGQEVDVTPAPESLGPGVMQRLSGQPQQAGGFDHQQVIEQTAAAAQPKKERKTRGKAAAETIPHDPATGEVIEEVRSAEFPIHPGHADPGVIYILAGQQPDEKGRFPTFRDGNPFSTAGSLEKTPIYESHAPEIEAGNGSTATDGAPSAAAEPASSSSATDASTASPPAEAASSPPTSSDKPAPGSTAAAPEIDAEVMDDDLPVELSTYVDAVEAARDFVTIKNALLNFQKTQTWKDASEALANKWRRMTWEAIEENFAIGARPNVAADASAFRLWIEAQDDADVVMATLSELESDAAFAKMDAAFKERVRGAAQARVNALEIEAEPV